VLAGVVHVVSFAARQVVHLSCLYGGDGFGTVSAVVTAQRRNRGETTAE
jgi:hypothetical protein